MASKTHRRRSGRRVGGSRVRRRAAAAPAVMEMYDRTAEAYAQYLKEQKESKSAEKSGKQNKSRSKSRSPEKSE